MSTPTTWLARGIPALREIIGLTQTGLARAVGVHRVSVARWERGAQHLDAGIRCGLEDVLYTALLDRAVATFRRYALASPSHRIVLDGGPQGPAHFSASITDADFAFAASLRYPVLVRLALDPSIVAFSGRAFEIMLGLPAGTLDGVPTHEKPDPKTGAPLAVLSAAEVGLELEVRIRGTTRARYLATVSREAPEFDADEWVMGVGLLRIQGEVFHQLRMATTLVDVPSLMLAALKKSRESRGSSPLPGVDLNGGERSGTTGV